MKLSKRKLVKRLLLASVAATTLTWCGTISAEDIKPDKPSANSLEFREGRYDFIYGGGDESNTGAASSNRVNISGGRFNGVFGGTTYGYRAHNNYVVISGGTIEGVVGGVTVWSSDWNVGDVYGNTVVISDGTITNVSGGEMAYMTSGTTITDFSNMLGNVHDNVVIIRGGTVSNVIGGAALGGNAYNNTIEIRGGTVTGDVVGGQTRNGEAYDNTITISGNPDLSGANLWGGRIDSNTATYTGNTLNLNTWGITAQNITGFETINFNLPAQISGTGLTVTNTLDFGSGLERINVWTRGDSNVGTGSTLNLIYSNGGINLGSKTLLATSGDETDKIYYNAKMSRGVTFDYDLALALSEDGRSLTGTVGRHGAPKPETETTTKAQLANVIPINVGTDNLINNFNDSFGGNFGVDDDGYFIDGNDGDDSNGGESDKAQKAEDVREQHGFEIFGSANFGHLKTKTGNGKIKTESNNFDLGLARTYEGPTGRWTFAPVVEHGKGNYDAFLSNGVKGYGDTKYTAGGFIARRVNNSGYYFEGSLRFGRAKNDFVSDDFIVSGQPTRATYHTSAPVFAGHIRIGQAKRLNKSNLLDVYAIYAYTRQGGSDTTLSTGEDYKFGSVSSSRFRLGYRLTTRTSKISRIYTGLAWQYEHTSDSTTRTVDAEGLSWSLPSSGAKGSSGMLEFGWLIKPRKDNLWLVDINATGWIGHQKGLTAMAKVKKSF